VKLTNDTSHGGALRFEREIPAEQETLIALQVVPHAVCHLFHDQDTQRRMQLDADENGIVRFHLRAAKDAPPTEFRLEQTVASGSPHIHTIAISHNPQHWPQSVQTAVATRTNRVRPALTADPAGLTNSQLIAQGYPPRPDPKRWPARYARWRRLASQAFDIVNPKTVSHETVRFGQHHATAPESAPRVAAPLRNQESALAALRHLVPHAQQLEQALFNASSGNWSGAYFTNPTNEFFLVEADWTVPTVVGGASVPPYSAVAQWVGLGNSPNDLFQSGSDSECSTYFDGRYIATNYWMWTEVLPFAPAAVSNFPLSAGDHVSVDIFVADQNGDTTFQQGSGGGLTRQDNSVWFMLYNTTKHLAFWGTVPIATSSDQFHGQTAEFMIERPTDLSTGQLSPLANFRTSTMRNCAYGDAWYGNLQQFALEPNDGTQPFDGTLQYQNMVNASTGDRLATAFSCQNDNSFGGNLLFWVWTNYS